MSEAFSGTWQILVSRDLSGGTLWSQLIHACRDSTVQWAFTPLPQTDKREVRLNGMPPEDTRNVILIATKAQLAKLVEDLTAAGIPHRTNKEISGELQGVVTSVGLITTDKAKVDPFIEHLKKAKFFKLDLEAQLKEETKQKEVQP